MESEDITCLAEPTEQHNLCQARHVQLQKHSHSLKTNTSYGSENRSNDHPKPPEILVSSLPTSGRSSALDIPPTNLQTAASSSRSLTTLIRDLHAEFPELEDINDESWTDPLSFKNDERDFVQSQQGVVSVIGSDSSRSISSILFELELVATTVRALPVPRPPSLSSTDWENALESPDLEINAEAFPGEYNPDSPNLVSEQEYRDQPTADRPPIPRRTATMDIPSGLLPDVTTTESPAVEKAPSAPDQADESDSAMPQPSKSRSLKNILSLKRTGSTVQASATPSSAGALKPRSRGITSPNLNARWRAEQSRMHVFPVEPVSFLSF